MSPCDPLEEREKALLGLGFFMKSFVKWNQPLLGDLTLYRKIAVSWGILKSEPSAPPIYEVLYCHMEERERGPLTLVFP